MKPALILLTLGLLIAGPAALAQTQPKYKVVGPDGRVTYTDRPGTDPGSRVVPLGREAPAPEATPLPLELRQAAARFPVTLYSGSDCAPCDGGRRLLQQRGIPYVERQVASDDDLAALNRLTGARTVPVLTIGAQVLRGFLESDWQDYLDAADYPRASRLPRNYQAPAPVPLVARVDAGEPARQPVPVLAEPRPAPLAPATPSGIRF